MSGPLRLGRVQISRSTGRSTINVRRRRINPRLIAPIAFLVAFTAIALEIAYTIGRFFNGVATQIH